MAVNPDLALWRAVVFQAIFDATHVRKPKKIRSMSAASVNKRKRDAIAADYYRRDARAWLAGTSDDYRNACENAGLCPVRLRSHLQSTGAI